MSHITRNGAPLVAIAALAGACAGSDKSRQAGADSAAADSAAMTGSAAGSALKVSNVMIGRRLGAGNRIIEPTFEFTPRETVYVSVGTQGGGGGSGTLTAGWRSQSGEILQQSSEPVRPAGENTVFQLSQPKGFKPGTYKVVLFLENDSADTKVFVVRK